jgi:hypothetical protein
MRRALHAHFQLWHFVTRMELSDIRDLSLHTAPHALAAPGQRPKIVAHLAWQRPTLQPTAWAK